MGGPLGCVNDYHAILHRRGGQYVVAELGPVSSLEWNRRLSETATAQVVVEKANATAQCCAAMGDVSPWAHELSIYRGTDLVWQGPVVRPVESRTAFTIDARDVTAWFDVRTMQASYMYSSNPPDPKTHLPPYYQPTGGPQEAVRLAERYIRDVFTPGRPNPNPDFSTTPLSGLDVNLMTYLKVTYGTDTIEHSAYEGVDILGERFNDIADDNLDYTTVGRRIAIGPPDWLYATGAVARLTEDDFAADVELAVEGDMTATEFHTYPGDFERDWFKQEQKLPDLIVITDPYWIWGSAGSDSPFYGRVERVAEIDSASKHESTFNNRAARYRKRTYPAPIVVRVSDEAALAPSARIGVPDLVCGSRIDIILSGEGWCRPTSAAFILSGVTGRWDADGERISIALEASNENVLPE